MGTPSIRDRTRAANPFPEGTLAVGAGLAVTGLASYGFLVLSARALGPERYAGLSVLWALVYLIGPGAFFPLEQEVARSVAARAARGLGAAPLIRRAGLAGGAIAAIGLAGLALTRTSITDRLFGGEGLLTVALGAGLVALGVHHLHRGAFSGSGRFRPYGWLVAVEGLMRFIPCALLAIWGAATPGSYGLVLCLSPIAASLFLLPAGRGVMTPGPTAPWAELSKALGYLLAASLLAQFIVNAGPLAVRLLAPEGEEAAVSRFLSGLIVARVPLFLFMAVQASLLPRLSALAARGDLAGFRRGLTRLMTAVILLGATATGGAFAVGPQVQQLMFGEGFLVKREDLALLAAGAGAFMVALAAGQALIALSGYASLVAGWALGAVSLVAAVAVGSDLIRRVALAFLIASVVSAASLTLLLLIRMRHPVISRSGSIPPGDLPLEP